MSEEVDDGIERTPAKDNPWGKFLLATIKLDKNNPDKTSSGWHWLCALEDLTGLKTREIQKKLPEEHPYKSIEIKHLTASKSLKNAIKQLKKELKISGDIKEINFSQLEFDEETSDFFAFIFPIKTIFTETVFHRKTVFSAAVFCDEVIFNKVIFKDEASFNTTAFNANSDFTNATFIFSTFLHAKFLGSANFAGTEFINLTSFDDATFHGEAFFASIKTNTHTDFINTKFRKYPPYFHNATLYPGVRWNENLNFWPNPKERNDNYDDEEHRKILKRNIEGYENLVFHMKKLERYHDEHFFFRHEMRCRKELVKGNPLVYFTYWLYETFSNYGYGIVRALLWWAVHILAGAVLLLAHYFCNLTDISLNDLGCSLGISFSNAHSILSLHKGPLMNCYDSLKGLYFYNTIWGVQTVLGVLFLFLVLLTLRTRFRLR